MPPSRALLVIALLCMCFESTWSALVFGHHHDDSAEHSALDAAELTHDTARIDTSDEKSPVSHHSCPGHLVAFGSVEASWHAVSGRELRPLSAPPRPAPAHRTRALRPPIA